MRVWLCFSKYTIWTAKKDYLYTVDSKERGHVDASLAYIAKHQYLPPPRNSFCRWISNRLWSSNICNNICPFICIINKQRHTHRMLKPFGLVSFFNLRVGAIHANCCLQLTCIHCICMSSIGTLFTVNEVILLLLLDYVFKGNHHGITNAIYIPVLDVLLLFKL